MTDNIGRFSPHRHWIRTAALTVSAAVVLAGASSVSASADATAQRPERAAHSEVAMHEAARQVLASGAPGYTARINDGETVTATAAGLADRATGRPLAPEDQFEIGSNTKTFTAVLALQLVDRRQLDLDAKVAEYLPGVVPNGRNITIRMLLNHTSGLFDYTEDPGLEAELKKYTQRVYTDRELLNVAVQHPPLFAPGESWSYSNTNYIIVGMVLQRVTGQTLPVLVQRRIARPLGLKHTYYPHPRATNTDRGYARGYSVEFGAAPRTYTDVSTMAIGSWGGAAGAIISTPRDLSDFFAAVMSGKLFSSRQLAAMKTTVNIPSDFGIDGSYGLGLIKQSTPCGTVWGHGGDTLGHHSTTAVTADGRRTAVTNTTAGPSDTAKNQGVDRYIKAVVAAEHTAICKMLGKPIPASVSKALLAPA